MLKLQRKIYFVMNSAVNIEMKSNFKFCKLTVLSHAKTLVT